MAEATRHDPAGRGISGHGEDAPGRWRPSGLLRVSAALHAAGAVALASVPAKWPLIAGGLFLNHCLLATTGMLPRSQGLGPNLTRLPTKTADDRVALTFDDGPDPEVTPRVLDLLAEHSATASFFLIGRRAERHPELVAEIVRRGHQLENHTYSHPNTFAFHGPRAQGRNIDRAQEILTRASGRAPQFFRAPAGIRNPWLDAVLWRRGLRLASWTRRGLDTADGDPARVGRRLLTDLAAGDVLLLHDGSAARDPDGQAVSLTVLPRLLTALAERGLRATPLAS